MKTPNGPPTVPERSNWISSALITSTEIPALGPSANVAMRAGTSLGSYLRNGGKGGIGKSTYMKAKATAPRTATCTNRLTLPLRSRRPGGRTKRNRGIRDWGLGIRNYSLIPNPAVGCLTFSHPDLPRSKSAGPRHVIGLSICRLGTGLTVGSGLAPDPPLPCIRQRVAGSSVLSERNYRRSGINHSSQYPVATDQHAASFALATGYCLLATRRSHPAPKVVLCGCQQQC